MLANPERSISITGRFERTEKDPSLCFALLAPGSYKTMVCNIKEQQKSFSHQRVHIPWQYWESTSIWNVTAEIYVVCVWKEREPAAFKLWQGPVLAKSCHILAHMSVLFCILTKNGDSCFYKKLPKLTANHLIQSFSSTLVFPWPVTVGVAYSGETS